MRLRRAGQTRKEKSHRLWKAATGGMILPGEEAEFVASHALADLPGVGPRFSAALRRRGLIDVRDALPAPGKPNG